MNLTQIPQDRDHLFRQWLARIRAADLEDAGLSEYDRGYLEAMKDAVNAFFPEETTK